METTYDIVFTSTFHHGPYQRLMHWLFNDNGNTASSELNLFKGNINIHVKYFITFIAHIPNSHTFKGNYIYKYLRESRRCDKYIIHDNTWTSWSRIHFFLNWEMLQYKMKHQTAFLRFPHRNQYFVSERLAGYFSDTFSKVAITYREITSTFKNDQL